MQQPTDQALSWIRSQRDQMIELLIRWANINSHSHNPSGLKVMAREVLDAFLPLSPNYEWISLDGQEAKAIQLTKRPQAPIQVLLGGHLDTVFPATHPFQQVRWLDDDRLEGPGVADMKGGIVILLTVLEAVERTPLAEQIGWRVLLTPDEEIGSPYSRSLWETVAKEYQFGLLFEPALSDGALVSRRKSSANFAITAHGLAAHAGRDFFIGRNSIVAMAKLIDRLQELSSLQTGTTVNIGRIEGGEGYNVVAPSCTAYINVRTPSDHAMTEMCQTIDTLLREVGQQSEVTFSLEGGITRWAKPLDDPTQQLLERLGASAEELGIPLQWKETGGVCDGNILSHAGLPTIDTMGVCGDKSHTPEEFVWVDSLVERALLTTHFLLQQAASLAAP